MGLLNYFWVILLVAIVISEFLTKSWYERIMMFIYYALGLLFAVHIPGWGWKLAFVLIMGAILRETDDGKTPFSPSQMVAASIVTAMVLYTITVKWLPFSLLQGIAGVITTGFAIMTLISASKTKSAKE